MEARRFEHTKDWKQILGQFDGYKCVLCSQQKVSPVVYLLSSEVFERVTHHVHECKL